MKIRIAAALALCAFSAARPTAAAPSLADHVNGTGLEKAYQQLTAKNWKGARKEVLGQLERVAEQSGKAPHPAAVALALLALADAGTGQTGPAICRWDAAQSLDPTLSSTDLSAYGEAGAVLAAAQPVENPLPIDNQRMTPPKKLAGKPPGLTLAAHRAGRGQLVIEAVIDRDGQIRNPKPVQGAELGMGVMGANALCDWRFKPATLNGQPVDVIYQMTVTFRRIPDRPLRAPRVP
jgi:Gram-negative bacterial TonB protein C-terminal